jgi:hypothetical protein
VSRSVASPGAVADDIVGEFPHMRQTWHRDLRTMRGYVQRAGLLTESPVGVLDLSSTSVLRGMLIRRRLKRRRCRGCRHRVGAEAARALASAAAISRNRTVLALSSPDDQRPGRGDRELCERGAWIGRPTSTVQKDQDSSTPDDNKRPNSASDAHLWTRSTSPCPAIPSAKMTP